MKRLLTAILVMTVVLLGGCMKVHLETNIDKDGSGTCTIEYGMAREVAEAMDKLQEMDSNSMGGEDMPDFSDMKRDEMEKTCQQAGVKLLDHEYADDAEGRRLTMTIGFDDVSKLSHVLDEVADGEGEGGSLGIFETADGNLILKTVVSEMDLDDDDDDDGDDLDENMDQDDPADMQAAMQYMGVLMAHIGDMDVRMTFTVPGEIISSNAMEVEDRTSIWAVNAANMMQAEEMDMEPNIIFSSKGLKIKASKLTE